MKDSHWTNGAQTIAELTHKLYSVFFLIKGLKVFFTT